MTHNSKYRYKKYNLKLKNLFQYQSGGMQSDASLPICSETVIAEFNSSSFYDFNYYLHIPEINPQCNNIQILIRQKDNFLNRMSYTERIIEGKKGVKFQENFLNSNKNVKNIKITNDEGYDLKIQNNFLNNFENLESIDLTESQTNDIGENIFINCPNLRNIICTDIQRRVIMKNNSHLKIDLFIIKKNAYFGTKYDKRINILNSGIGLGFEIIEQNKEENEKQNEEEKERFMKNFQMNFDLAKRLIHMLENGEIPESHIVKTLFDMSNPLKVVVYDCTGRKMQNLSTPNLNLRLKFTEIWTLGTPGKFNLDKLANNEIEIPEYFCDMCKNNLNEYLKLSPEEKKVQRDLYLFKHLTN
jgi:hypothetical protein